MLAGSIGGAGTIDFGASATLTLGGAVSQSSIAFSAGGGDTLVLSSPAAVASSLTGFGQGDVIDIERIKANSLSYGGGVLTVYEDHLRADALVVSGADSGRFGLASDGHGGTDIMFTASAFVPSTVVLPRLASSNADQIMRGFAAHMLL